MREITYAFKKIKNSQSFENLNDADIISMPMFATCKVKMELIILFMRNRQSAFVFRRRIHSEVLCRIGTSSIDNKIHDDDVRNRRRIGSTVSFSAGKTKVKQYNILTAYSLPHRIRLSYGKSSRLLRP